MNLWRTYSQQFLVYSLLSLFLINVLSDKVTHFYNLSFRCRSGIYVRAHQNLEIIQISMQNTDRRGRGSIGIIKPIQNRCRKQSRKGRRSIGITKLIQNRCRKQSGEAVGASGSPSQFKIDAENSLERPWKHRNHQIISKIDAGDSPDHKYRHRNLTTNP